MGDTGVHRALQQTGKKTVIAWNLRGQAIP